MGQMRYAAVFVAMIGWVWSDAAIAQAPGDATPRYLSSQMVAGVNFYTPGEWGVLGFGVDNPRDEGAEVLAAMHFEGEPSLQYGRQLWIPPRARRFASYPVFTPETIPAEKQRVGIKTLLIDRTGGRDQLIASRSGEMLETGLLNVEQKRPLTALLSDVEDGEVRELVVAARIARQLGWHVPGLRLETLPTSVEALGALDQLVISSDALASDAAALLALRRWLYDGGKLWIMLDQVEPQTVSRLLGDTLRVQLVDRVELTEFTMSGIDEAEQPWQGSLRQFDEPVALARVFAPELNVTHTINGWPAAFWQQVGRGQVLYTTLGATGWTRPRTPEDVVPAGARNSSSVMATDPLNHLALRYFEPQPESPLPVEAIEQPTVDRIGYSIVGRGAVVLLLGGFCLTVLGLGLWLQHAGRLEHLGWVGPTAALLVTLVLGVVGGASRRAVPTTVATTQFVEIVPGAEDVQLAGVMALYNQDQSDAPLGGTGGATFLPDMTGQDGTTRRLVTTDFDAWHWENLTLPAGVRLARYRYGTKLAEPLVARATLGPAGLTGELSAGPFQNLSDAIIATPARRAIAVELNSPSTFIARAIDSLPPGQYLGENLVSDVQRRRQEIYKRLLARPNQEAYPTRPTLFFWADPLDPQFEFATDVHRTGAALVALPLELERPAPNTSILLPPALLPYKSVRGPGNMGMSAAYKNGEWLGPLTSGSEIFLQFQLPRELLPLRLERVMLTVKINAPGRTFDVLGLRESQRVELERRESPLGVLQFEIDRSDVLQLDNQGRVTLVLRVGSSPEIPTAESASADGWKIDFVDLQAQALVLTP